MTAGSSSLTPIRTYTNSTAHKSSIVGENEKKQSVLVPR
jgi:hypothetical protein